MLEPQSTGLFVLLLVVFAAAVTWLARARNVAVRVLAALLTFIPAAFFGIVLVNKYYGYYQSWGAAVADVTGTGGPGGGPPGRHLRAAGGMTEMFGSPVYASIARQDGYTAHLLVHGRASHLTRNLYVYLPPQYFQPRYRSYRFPVIELVHGYPGEPQDWITVVGITAMLHDLVGHGLAKRPCSSCRTLTARGASPCSA